MLFCWLRVHGVLFFNAVQGILGTFQCIQRRSGHRNLLSVLVQVFVRRVSVWGGASEIHSSYAPARRTGTWGGAVDETQRQETRRDGAWG